MSFFINESCSLLLCFFHREGVVQGLRHLLVPLASTLLSVPATRQGSGGVCAL